MLDYILIGCAAFIIIFALRYFIKLTERDKPKTAGTRQKMYSFANCPLCAFPLYKEDLYSRVFRPMTVSDQRCIILGCPHVLYVIKKFRRKDTSSHGFLIKRRTAKNTSSLPAVRCAANTNRREADALSSITQCPELKLSKRYTDNEGNRWLYRSISV